MSDRRDRGGERNSARLDGDISGELPAQAPAPRSGSNPLGGPLSRRRLLQIGAVTGAGALAASADSALAHGRGGKGHGHDDHHGNDHHDDHHGNGHQEPWSPKAGRFADPDRTVQPKFRWWWPNALVDNARDRDARSTRWPTPASAAPRSPTCTTARPTGARPRRATAGARRRGSTPSQTALERAKARGMTIDLTAGPSWPAAVPSDHARQPRRDQGARLRPRDRRRRRRRSAARAPAPVVAPERRRHAARSCCYVQAAKVTTAGNPPDDRLHARRRDAVRTSRRRDGTSAGPRPPTATGS